MGYYEGEFEQRSGRGSMAAGVPAQCRYPKSVQEIGGVTKPQFRLFGYRVNRLMEVNIFMMVITESCGSA